MNPDRSAVLVAFGRRVRQLRQAGHRTVADVAALAGITAERLAAVELGQAEATVAEAFLLATALEVPTGALFTGAA